MEVVTLKYVSILSGVTCECTPKYVVKVLAKYDLMIFTFTNWKTFSLIQVNDAIFRFELFLLPKKQIRCRLNTFHV